MDWLQKLSDSSAAPLMESQTPLSNLDEEEKRGGCPKRLETLDEDLSTFLGLKGPLYTCRLLEFTTRKP